MNNKIKRPNPKFTLEFKRDAAKRVNEKGYIRQQAADSLGISLSAMGPLVEGGTEFFTSSGAKVVTKNLAESAELLKLRKEVEQLIVPLFLRKIFPGILLEKSAKITRQPLPSAAPAVCPSTLLVGATLVL